MRVVRARTKALTLALLLLAACSAPATPAKPAAPATPAAPPAAARSAALTRTTTLVRVEDRSNVCMLSNRYFGADRKQVPAAVGDKTYYGCCARCAAHLEASEQARMAVDPVTGHAVDKAAAILAHDEHNAVVYFESEESFARYTGG
jgi:hypothetical protein